ncbi:MAG TPA: glycosyltransferase family 87 protein [Gemmatales bacterium]|nr:glycosyltransferase family 87 protein [Gemmatales bacterium]HMP61183.1 glycosyltransferase family 87 protein [Gemmatales bacterium]
MNSARGSEPAPFVGHELTIWQKWGLQLAAAALLLYHAPAVLGFLAKDPASGGIFDFYQEWGSARNWFEGLPVYSSQVETIKRYFGVQFVSLTIKHNAHPPAVVLLTLPLGRMDYVEALAFWNTLSLLLIGASVALTFRALQWRLSGWWVLPIVALVVAFNPFYQQCMQGQLGGVLLFLLTLAWLMERSGRFMTAGALLGLATAIKLFPGFLVLGLLVRGRWLGVIVATLVWAALQAAAWGVLGGETFRDYVTVVLPGLNEFRTHVTNSSILAFGHKLFVGDAAGHVLPLWHAPVLAWLLAGALGAIVAGLALWLAWRSRSGPALDMAIGANVAAMMLLSPLTWDHSLLMVVPWLIGAVRWVPRRITPYCVLGFIVLGMSVDHVKVWYVMHQERYPADLPKALALAGAGRLELLTRPVGMGPWAGALALRDAWELTPVVPLATTGVEVLGPKGLPFYTLLAWFGFQAWLAWRLGRESATGL